MPAFRRADRVGATVRGLLPLVDRVVVVDDGSDDGGATAGAAREAGATVVVLAVNRGKGGALTAGIAAAPDASTYLLVDADTAGTAAATAPLLDAVREGADLAIGVLPPAGGRGGFGTVRTVAAWGIRRACAFEAEAPLSGQRAVRGSLLRSLALADRFGVEVGMTIDAVRAGAHVVEVPVGVDHAHTGRGVAGFSHRAAQGFDLLRALGPRLLASRTRTLLLVGVAVVGVALLAVAAAAAVPTGAPLGTVDRVVLVAAAPTLDLGDLDDPQRPQLAALAGGRGAVAAANVDVPGRGPWSTWATVSAGATLEAGPPTRDPDPRFPFLVQDIEDGQGRLGDAVRAAGRRTAFVGASPLSPVRLAVADGKGEIDRTSTASSLGVAGLVNRSRTELATGVSLLAVDAGGLDPADLDALLGALLPADGERRLVLLVTPADPATRFGLRPLLASGPGAPAGRLVSPSTRRNGLVVLSDVAPTILQALDLPVPEDMVGRPLRRLAANPDVPGLVAADRLSRQRDTVWDPALLGIVPLHGLVYGLAWRRHRRRTATPSSAVSEGDPVAAQAGTTATEPPGSRPSDRDRAGRALAWVGLGLVAWPLATWIVRAAPGASGLGRWALVAALVADGLVVQLARRLGRRGLGPLAIVLAATVALMTIDLGLGGALQLSSAFGGAAHSAGRFTGLGNAAFSVYAGCALMAVHCGRRRAPWMVALLVTVAVADALPPLGGDVGGAVTLAPVFTLTVAALWDRLSWRAVVLSGGATALLIGMALAFDLPRPEDGRTHLARYVSSGGRSSSIGGKVGQNLDTYATIPPLVLVVAVVAAAALLLWRGRFRHLLPPGTPARIAVGAALATAIVGNLLNDSGPIVTLLVLSIVAPALVVRSTAIEPAPQILPPPSPDPEGPVGNAAATA